MFGFHLLEVEVFLFLCVGPIWAGAGIVKGT